MNAKRSPQAGAILRFIGACIGVNVQNALEYRASFFSSALSMTFTDAMWVAFWGLYFHRFPVMKGWTYHDILMLWAIGAAGIGLGFALFGNSQHVSRIIATGEFDIYLTLPKPALLHVLVSRTQLTSWGDLLFGVVVFLATGIRHPWDLPLFLLAMMLVAGLVVIMTVMTNLLAFFFGNSESLSDQMVLGMITFSTYPIDIFHGVTRVLLFTVIPAGFISSMPILLFRSIHVGYLLGAIAVEALFFVLLIVVYRAGLRRYTSGNTLISRQ